MSRFVTAQELLGKSGNVVLIDCDLPPAYHRFHLPGAFLAPCRYWKDNGSDSGLFGIEEPVRLAQLLSGFGIEQDSEVVAYDSSGGLNAARLGWTLERFGFSNFKVLDGGPGAWLGAGGELSQAVPQRVESSLNLTGPTNENRCSIEDLESLDDDTVLWDDRSPAEWERGRIPGAVLLPWDNLLTPERHLLDESLLRELLAGKGISAQNEIVIYCAGGIRAAHSYWVLKHLGYERVRVYDGSWSEYGKSGLKIEG